LLRFGDENRALTDYITIRPFSRTVHLAGCKKGAKETKMRRAVQILLTLGAVTLVAGAASATLAQASPQSTPSGWNYEIKDGKRVPKAERKVNADGSWREESKQGSCVTVKEKTASGEYKESRRCD
jgi:hypothetical protein